MTRRHTRAREERAGCRDGDLTPLRELREKQQRQNVISGQPLLKFFTFSPLPCITGRRGWAPRHTRATSSPISTDPNGNRPRAATRMARMCYGSRNLGARLLLGAGRSLQHPCAWVRTDARARREPPHSTEIWLRLAQAGSCHCRLRPDGSRSTAVGAEDVDFPFPILRVGFLSVSGEEQDAGRAGTMSHLPSAVWRGHAPAFLAGLPVGGGARQKPAAVAKPGERVGTLPANTTPSARPRPGSGGELGGGKRQPGKREAGGCRPPGTAAGRLGPRRSADGRLARRAGEGAAGAPVPGGLAAGLRRLRHRVRGCPALRRQPGKWRGRRRGGGGGGGGGGRRGRGGGAGGVLSPALPLACRWPSNTCPGRASAGGANW